MKKNIALFLLLIFSVSISIVMSGCFGVDHIIQKQMAEKRARERRIKQEKIWSSYTIKESRGKIVISNFSTKPTEKHVLKISGKVSSYYTIETGEKRMGGFYGNKVEKRNVYTRKVNFLPTKLKINSDLCYWQEVNINSDGSVEGKIKTRHWLNLTRPSRGKLSRKYFTLYKIKKKMRLEPKGLPDGIWLSSITQNVYVFEYQANKRKVRNYADKMTCGFYINFKNKINGVSVSPTYKIIPRKLISQKQLESIFFYEYGDIKTAKEQAKMIFSGSPTPIQHNKESYGDSAYVYGVVGSKYALKTVHPKFHQQKVSFQIKKNQRNKELLLIETGRKVRVQNIDEGESGNFVDE